MMTAFSQQVYTKRRITETERLVLYLVAILFCLIATLIWVLAEQTIEVADYSHAPICGSHHGSFSSDDCISYETMQIINRTADEDEGTSYYLDLRNSVHFIDHLSVPDFMATVAPPGNVVAVKLWRGQPMIVRASGIYSKTSYYPGVRNGICLFFLVIFSIGEYFVVAFYVKEAKRIPEMVDPVPSQ